MRRHRPLQLCAVLAALLVACDRAENPASRQASEPPLATYTQLADAYAKAHAPQNPDLTGVWAEIRWIATLPYLSGQNGPDRVLFDSTGLRNANDSGKPLTWTLTFARLGPMTYSITQRTAGNISVPQSVTADSSGAFRFDVDDEGDEGSTYTCRITRRGRLVCLDAKHTGEGMEFKQMSTSVPPPPPPFCPLAGVSECPGSSAGVDARRILADAAVCYHLPYPVTHRPQSSEETDTWLVLGGDSMPPIGAWHYAAVFDDSIVRVAAWRRTVHTPRLPENAHPEFPPQRDTLELRLTFKGTNVRGVLGYGDSALRGSMFGEDTPYSWGVDGERRACPKSRDDRGIPWER